VGELRLGGDNRMITSEADYQLDKCTDKPYILIVDDEEDILRPILTRIIRHYKNKFEPIICIDGDEAFASIRRYHIALIILDIQMLNVDGKAVCRFLKKHPQYRNIPVLISSGFIDDDLRQELGDLGIKHFLHKPYTMDTLIEHIDRILG